MSNSSTRDASRTEHELSHRYNGRLANDIERRWQEYWESHETFRTPNPGEPGFDATRPRFYCLDMFPYPSGKGLHVGHPVGYTATDIVCRYKRHRGFNVLHPMGWDAFGLPAEQYAIQTNVHPAITTRNAIDMYRGQLKRFGFSYDWSREFATIDPDYYRWTQWIWLQAYDAWYDKATNRARPIHELVDAFRSGATPVAYDPDRPAGFDLPEEDEAPTFGAWDELDRHTQRRILSTYRLAYLSTQTVNWCPKLGTALANEEVIDGKSERGGYPVARLPLRQWMFRITAFADRLLTDLDLVEWPESTKTMQREWIGRSEGARIDFPINDAPAGAPDLLRVYTTRPDTIFGATYMVVAPEHPLVEAVLAHPPAGADPKAIAAYVETARNRADVDRMAESREKTGVASGCHATNPATGETIPIWIADYVLMGYGHGAIMAVPAHDDRDFAFARKFELPIRTVVVPDDGDAPTDEAFTGQGRAANSSNADVSLDGKETTDAKATIITWLEQKKLGRGQVNFRLRDWLFSRQRYWGEPFPIVYDEHGDHYPVAAAHLPVTLPDVPDYHPEESDEPTPLLNKATTWVNTTAGAAGVDPAHLPADAPVRRELNTMPGWAGSCWYYLRYCDPKNTDRLVGAEAEAYWMHAASPDQTGGVDLYVGGAEHAVLHLLYARFWHKLLFDLGVVGTPEPMAKLFHQGMMTSYAYQRGDKSLVAVDDVEERDGGYVERGTGAPVTQVIAKMSKSLRNVVNPDDVFAEYGADTLRLYEMYMGPLEASKPWNTKDIVGIYRFLQRVWRLAVDEHTGALKLCEQPSEDVERLLHHTIAKVGDDIERLALNTAIAAMIEFVNEAYKADGLSRDQLDRFAILLSPFAPHLAEELWARLGHAPTIAAAPWPTVDESMLTVDEIELPVQVMGKVRSKITVAAESTPDEVEALVRGNDRIKEVLGDKTIRKIIVVPGRIVNIIAG